MVWIKRKGVGGIGKVRSLSCSKVPRYFGGVKLAWAGLVEMSELLNTGVTATAKDSLRFVI